MNLTITAETLARPDLPVLLRLAERMREPELGSGTYASIDIRWQTWTDNGKDVHIDHHFDDE